MPDDLLASRYQLIRVLGQGAMGVVWLAQDTVLDRPIALKELRPAPGVDAAEAVERFLVEARAAARLSHPNIVGVHDVFADGERVLIAMELVEGPTLEEVLRTSGKQPPEVVRAIMAQVAQALAVAHQAGVIHRDLKPDNIFWTPDGRAVVTDFGLARIGAGRGTVEGTIMGTPGYMAPEQVRGTPTGPQSDVFAWGAVAYTLATAEGPFGEPSLTDPTAMAYRIVHEDAAPLVIPDDPALAELIMRCLAKEPESRPSDGTELVALLVGASHIADEGPQGSHTELPTPARSPGPPNSRARVVAGCVIVALIAFVTLTIASVGGRDEPSENTSVVAATIVPTTPATTTAASRPRSFPEGAGVVEPGTYESTRFTPTVVFTVDGGWRSRVGEPSNLWELVRNDRPESNILTMVTVDRVIDPAAAPYTKKEAESVVQPRPGDLLAWLETHPRLRTTLPIDEPRPGATGARLDIEISSPYLYDGCARENLVPCVVLFGGSLKADFVGLEDLKYRFYVFTVGSAAVVISIEAPVEQFDHFAADAEALLGTLRFT